MKRWFVAFAMAVVPLCGAQDGAELPAIVLYTQFVQQPSGAVLDAMQREVQSIMAPMGLRFQWKDLVESNGRQVSIELAVITFKGRCEVAGLLPHDQNPGALGWTNISDGVILPFANVDCAAVRSFIQRELLNTHPAAREAAFGRALGRVLAHELYHIFADTTRHGAEGVAREFYTAHDLLAADFQFQAKESLALLHSKARAALAASSPWPVEETEHRE